MKNNILMNILKEILEKEYLILAQKIYKSNESTEGNVYILETNNNKYVVKIYKDLNHVQNMIYIHNFLIQNIIVPKIIKNKNNTDYIVFENNYYLVVYSFMQGIQLNKLKNKNKKEIINKLASTLKNIHDLTQNKNMLKNIESPILIDNKIDRYSLLHFDLTKSNIFYNEKNNEIELIDFDDFKYGQSVFDVAILIANLFISKKNGFDIENAKLFIDYYYNNDIELKNKEVPFIKECAIKWIDYITNINEFDSSTKDSFKLKKELILNNGFIN